MAIKIFYDPENKSVFIGEPEKELSLTSDEEVLLEIIFSFLSDSVEVSMLGIEKRSNDYTSVIYGGLNDFLRFKYTSRTKWISLRLPISIQKENINNPLFSLQKNKRQLHWKAALSSLDDLEKFKPFIIASCVP